MKRFLAAFLIGAALFTTVGCEIDGDVDDDGDAKIKVDVDD